MGKALYRKYRSRKLSEIVGQEHVTTLLRNALKSDRIAHAYLFTGPRGVGKTSIARILAHEINELPYSDESTHLDIIEIDAASNNGVDDIRELRDKVNLAPTSAKKKVYIIDEVHMLSKAAFNALLKTLEEPPEHVVFILATTDVEKLPETVISRTQRHTFRRASIDNIVKNLRLITKKEKVAVDDAALELIAKHSDGSYRDSVSLLDQLRNTAEDNSPLTAEMIENTLGLAPADTIDRLLNAAISHDFEKTTSLLSSIEASGMQANTVAAQLIGELRTRVTDAPELFPLLDALLDVRTSPLPQAKLLVVLGSYAAAHTRRAEKAAAATTPTIAEAPIPELVEKASEIAPIDDIEISPEPSPKPSGAAAEHLNPASPTNVDIQKLIADAKGESIGLHTLLAQSSIIPQDGKLIIYAKNAFNMRRLNAAKNLRSLQNLLAIQGNDGIVLEILPHGMPSNNSQVASVAAIMGGGEEVNVSETVEP